MDKFSHNGVLKPIKQAQHSLMSVEFSYGFGVYENIRVKDGGPRFLDEHVERLMKSASLIELEHPWSVKEVSEYICDLVAKISEPAYNLKILLIGGEKPDLYVLPLRPKFPDRKLYKTGAKAVIIRCERYLPNVKSLNMLPSYLAMRDAKKMGAYDALLENNDGCLVEGTKTNLFGLKSKRLTTAPDNLVLQGVTRSHVIELALANGYTIDYEPITSHQLDSYDSFFLTSTSSKIMPLSQINDTNLKISPELRTLMKLFDDWQKSNSSPIKTTETK